MVIITTAQQEGGHASAFTLCSQPGPHRGPTGSRLRGLLDAHLYSTAPPAGGSNRCRLVQSWGTHQAELPPLSAPPGWKEQATRAPGQPLSPPDWAALPLRSLGPEGGCRPLGCQSPIPHHRLFVLRGTLRPSWRRGVWALQPGRGVRPSRGQTAGALPARPLGPHNPLG